MVGLDNCTSNKDCSEREYCEVSATQCKGQGKCADRPDVCLMVYAPVCGCDGVTYGNLCEAAARGVSVISRNPCPSDGCLSDGAWYDRIVIGLGSVR